MNSTQPVVYCPECLDFEYCYESGKGFPPDTAKGKLEKRHKKTKCKGIILYRAGIQIGFQGKGMIK